MKVCFDDLGPPFLLRGDIGIETRSEFPELCYRLNPTIHGFNLLGIDDRNEKLKVSSFDIRQRQRFIIGDALILVAIAERTKGALLEKGSMKFEQCLLNLRYALSRSQERQA